MLVNHISTDPHFMSRQKKTLMFAWNKFKNEMTRGEKREYQIRLFTIKHLEQGFCELLDSKYFGSTILDKSIEDALF
jgi:hypothetical protein